MTLPVSGPISMNQVNVELGLAGTTNISLNQSNVRSLFGKPSGTISLSDGRGKTSTIYLTIASNTTRYNIFLSAGSPSVPTNVQVTVNSGVIVGSVTGGTDYAMYTGAGWAAGSTITIINNGYIQGIGGNGGSSGYGAVAPGAGGAGGDAILLSWPVNIGNNGYIYGGGGGGGAGFNITFTGYGGGGGGGGRSAIDSSSGGTGGYGGAINYPGSAGAPGGIWAAGAGGLGGAPDGSHKGGAGGDVGMPGMPGFTTAVNGSAQTGAAGGAAGKAINLNGYYVGWLYGNNSTQVKGAVS